MSGIHHPHSKFVVGTLKSRRDFARAIIELTIDGNLLTHLDLESLKTEDATFIDEKFKEHRSDLLFSAPGKNGAPSKNFYLLFEHKSHPDPNILGQLIRYLSEIHEQQDRKVPIITIVFYHGKEEWNIPRSLSELYGLTKSQVLDYGDQIFDFRYALLDAGQLEIQNLKATLAFRSFLKILTAIWFFEDYNQIKEFLIQFRELFFNKSEENFLRKMMSYIYGVRNIKPGQLQILINENVSSEKGYLAMTTAEKLRQEGKLEAAKNLLENGVALDIILKSTGLTMEQLKEAGIITD